MIGKLKQHTAKAKEKVSDSQTKSAQNAFMEDLFNDYYKHRAKVYKMNFIRGLFFGFGSVLGGTVVISLIVSLLSVFVDFWVIGEFFQRTQEALEGRQ